MVGSVPNRRWPVALISLGLLLLVGLGIRLYDLTDPPLDFHETRQLGSAIVARGMYYEMRPDSSEGERAAAVGLQEGVPTYEPRVLERLVALSYLIAGGEFLWIARIFSALFWVLGAVGLYLLAAGITSSLGGLVAVAFYLIIPYGVIASRSFQPDPLMTALIVFGLLTIWRWSEQPSPRRALIAGAICGAAILVKAVAVFPLMGAIFGAGIAVLGLKRLIRNAEWWMMVAAALLPSTFYYLVLTRQGSSGLFSFWVLSLRDLLKEPFFYIRWVQQVEYVIGFGWLVVGLIGSLLIPSRRARVLVLGAWSGYLVYGLALPFQIMTHDYYHLMLVPMVGLGLAPIGAAGVIRLKREHLVWSLLALAVIVLAAGYLLWDARVTLAMDDHRLEARGWERLGEAMPQDGPIIALTHAYGTRLEYYGRQSTQFWPGQADIGLGLLAGRGEFNYEAEFEQRTEGVRYFLVTNFAEFDQQPELKTILYERYPIHEEGDGYLLFDLEGLEPG